MSTTSATRVALVEHHLKRLDAVLRSFADDSFYEALDRSAQLGLEIQNHAAFVKIQAERKAGDLLAKMPRADTSQNAAKTKTEDQPGPPFSDVLRTAGIAPTRAKRWQELAQVPEAVVRKYVDTLDARGYEVTSAGVR